MIQFFRNFRLFSEHLGISIKTNFFCPQNSHFSIFLRFLSKLLGIYKKTCYFPPIFNEFLKFLKEIWAFLIIFSSYAQLRLQNKRNQASFHLIVCTRFYIICLRPRFRSHHLNCGH